MKRARVMSIMFGCVLAAFAVAVAAKDTSIANATERALQQSALTLPGGQPFHLKASISETSDPDTDDYKATIEEYWVSPTKWRRIITSHDFSQTLITNGDSVSEVDIGDYYPHWLSNFVTAVIEILPEPMVDALKKATAPMPSAGSGNVSTSCVSFSARVDRWVICIENDHGLFESIFTKGSGANYKEYKKFGNKWVARSVVDNPEPGTTVEARITELTDLTQPDEQMFQAQPTPRDQRIESVRVDEDTLLKLSLGSTQITWPPVGEGLLKGGCGVYVSADRSGQVREAIPEGCDNAALEEPLHDAVMTWRLKPAVADGVHVQVEALLGIPFQTTLDPAKSVPNLTDSEARELATNIISPIFPPGTAPLGTKFTVGISVDENGKYAGIQNSHNVPSVVFFAIDKALAQWHFKPYIKDGKPQYFHAELIFSVE